MSIVRMKRLRLVALASHRQALMADLLHLGCVEISEPEAELADPAWTGLLGRSTSDLAAVKAETNAMTSALDALQKYAPVKSGLFIQRQDISAAAFFDPEAAQAAQTAAREINERVSEIGQVLSRENQLTAQRDSLLPWVSLDLDLSRQETDAMELIPGACPAAADIASLRAELCQAQPLAELLEISSDKQQRYLLLMVHRSALSDALEVLKHHSFAAARFHGFSGTPAENIRRMEAELEQLERRRLELEQEIAARADTREALKLHWDRLNQDAAKEAASERALTDGTIFFLEGWAPAAKCRALERLFDRYECAFSFTDPAEGDTVPTLLENPRWMQCINMVTEMYSLPDYKGIDPNPLMFFWYVFFFGFMFADVAYGIIIFLISTIVTRKYKPKGTMGYMFRLGKWLGASTAICGVFVGGFFGNAIPVFAENFLGLTSDQLPHWLQVFNAGIIVNPVEDPMTVLIISIAIGCLHLIFGQCIHIYMGFRDGGPAGGGDALLDVVPWWIVFAGIALAVLGYGPALLIAGALSLLCTQGRHKKGVFGKIFGGIASLYDITSWLSDVLSYARLMALMLATSVIAQVFNTLGALPKMIVVFFIVFLIGHTFNIGVNLIGTYVHAARLQYLEFFGKFYKDGGVPFRPLQYKTKYVDINTEEEK